MLRFLSDLKSVRVRRTRLTKSVAAFGQLGLTNRARRHRITFAPELLESRTLLDADLSITKLASSDVVIAGKELFYDIRVLNAGPDTATNVVVTDTLVTGLIFLGDTAPTDPPGGCTFATDTVTCDLPNIPDNGSVEFKIKVRVAADFVSAEEDGTRTLSNTATVSSADDNNPGNDSSTELTFVEDEADLIISKFVQPSGTVRAGETFIYTIYVDNLGPSDARDVVIRDTLINSGLVELQSCAFSASQSGGGQIQQFTCDTGELVESNFGNDIATFAASRLVPFGIDPSDPNTPFGRLRGEFRLVARDDVELTNITRVFAATSDPDQSNNVATVNISVTPVSDLAITVNATGEEQQVNQPGLMFNNAVFGQAFPTAPNYFASTRVTAGRRIQYQLKVTNNGPSSAENVVVSDLLPAGVRIYQGSLTISQGSCDGGTPGQPLDRLTCGLGTLDAADPAVPGSGTATISFQVITDDSIPAGEVLVNESSVSSDSEDIDNSDNQAHTENSVLAAADLIVSKSNIGENVTGYDATLDRLIISNVVNAVTAGKVLRYEVAVQNNGPSDSQNVTISDALPSVPLPGPVTFLSATGATCRPDAVVADILSCSLGTLAAGARRTFDIYVLVDPSVPANTVLQNCVTALTGASNVVPPGAPPNGGSPTESLTWDPLTANNTDVCTSTTVNASADLTITKSASNPKPLPGEEVSYHIRVENLGPSAAANVIVTDTLPDNVSFEFDTDNCSLTSSDPDVVTCQLGTMQPGEVVDFDIIVEITAAAASGVELCDVAVVASDTTDFDTSNNTGTACSFTVPGANLSVTKSGPDTVNPGTNITYVITVTNSGPTAAIDVVLEDFIPIGERTLSVTPDSGNCLAGVAGDPNRPTTCNFGTVDPNETVTVTVVVEADNCLQDLNKLFNDVRVSSATFDPDNSDNVFHSSTEVRQTSNGNVKAVVSKGQLKVTGDNFNNTIRFDTPVEAGPDAIRITPFGGTRINGQCRSVQLHGVKGGVSVRMGRANDSVFFDGPITMKQLSVIVGLGNDTVALSGVTVNAGTTIRADGGDDVVSIIDSVLNAGPAQAGLGGVKQKSALTLRTGIGDDTVTIEGTQVVGSALIRNDGNDDFVRIVDSIFEAALKLEGGRDFDRIEMSVGNTFANTPSIKSFEEID